MGGRVRVASFNVLNYFTTLDTGAEICGPSGDIGCRGANTAEEFARQRAKVITAIAAMNAHVVGLIELENNPIASIQNLVDGLNVPVPGRYAFIDTGTIGTDAIRVALIYQPALVSPVGAFGVLDRSVDARAITTLNRPALAQTFEPVGPRASFQRFTVAVNHFKSKSSACTTAQNPGELDDPDTGDGQGNCNLTRISMAQALIDWLATNPTGDPTPPAKRRVLIIGDLNAYAREHPVRALTDPAFSLPGFPANANATYTDLIEAFVGADAYSYVFQGQSGYLDHALANQALLPFVRGVTEWHINADEPVALDYNLEWTASVLKNPNQQETLYAPDPFRSSDHDPLIVGLSPGGTHVDGATVYLGLKSSDDINTAFDLKIELESAGTPLGGGEHLCARNILRDPGRATSRTIPLDLELIPGATVTVRLLARIGTNPDGTRCTGTGATHASAGGLRFYYDAATRRSLLSLGQRLDALPFERHGLHGERKQRREQPNDRHEPGGQRRAVPGFPGAHVRRRERVAADRRQLDPHRPLRERATPTGPAGPCQCKRPAPWPPRRANEGGGPGDPFQRARSGRAPPIALALAVRDRRPPVRRRVPRLMQA